MNSSISDKQDSELLNSEQVRLLSINNFDSIKQIIIHKSIKIYDLNQQFKCLLKYILDNLKDFQSKRECIVCSVR